MPEKIITFDASLYMVNILTKEDFLHLNPEREASSVPDIEPGSVYIYGNGSYDGEQMDLMGTTFRVAGFEKYVAEKDLYEASLFKEDYYVLVDSTETMENLYQLQKELDEKPNGIAYYMGIDIDGTEEEKLACNDAIRSAISNVNSVSLRSAWYFSSP